MLALKRGCVRKTQFEIFRLIYPPGVFRQASVAVSVAVTSMFAHAS